MNTADLNTNANRRKLRELAALAHEREFDRDCQGIKFSNLQLPMI